MRAQSEKSLSGEGMISYDMYAGDENAPTASLPVLYPPEKETDGMINQDTADNMYTTPSAGSTGSMCSSSERSTRDHALLAAAEARARKAGLVIERERERLVAYSSCSSVQ